jgi:hypothetical protein
MTRVRDEREFASEGDQSLRLWWSCRPVRVPTCSVYGGNKLFKVPLDLSALRRPRRSENNSRPFLGSLSLLSTTRTSRTRIKESQVSQATNVYGAKWHNGTYLVCEGVKGRQSISSLTGHRSQSIPHFIFVIHYRSQRFIQPDHPHSVRQRTRGGHTRSPAPWACQPHCQQPDKTCKNLRALAFATHSKFAVV